jgi:hypothetical protein
MFRVNFNENHDERGRFAEGPGGGGNFIGFKPGEDFPGMSKTIDHIVGDNKELSDALQRAAFKDDLESDPYNRKAIALKEYTSNGYSDINRRLCDPTDVAENDYNKVSHTTYNGEKLDNTIATIDKAFEGSEIKDNLTTYRGVKDSILVSNPDLMQALDTPGSVFESPCYSSTSILPFKAEPFAEGYNGRILRMELPAGTKALYVAGISEIPGEHEVLVNRGTKYVVGETTKENIRSLNGSVYLKKVTTVRAIV